MKVFAAIIVLITSVVGFVFSYEIAYRNVVKVLNAPPQAQSAGIIPK